MLALSFLLLIGMSLIARGLRPAHPEGLHLLRDGLLGVRRDDQPAAAQGQRSRSTCTSVTATNPPARRRDRDRTDCMILHTRPARPRSSSRPPAAPPPAAAYVPQRVFDTRRGAFTDFESMVAELAAPTWCSSASSTTIRTRTGSRRACSRAARAGTSPLTVSLEMFERDVQDVGRHAISSGRSAEESS